jgi:hypothetical protein
MDVVVVLAQKKRKKGRKEREAARQTPMRVFDALLLLSKFRP